MKVSIDIEENIYNAAKLVAEEQEQGGSISKQIEFWAMIGKCALENPDLSIELIQELLLTKHADRSIAEPFSLEIK